MFAVIKTGGKQYKVAENDVVKVEKLGVAPGDKVEFDALMIGDDKGVKVGAPTVDGARVSAEVIDHDRTRKVLVFKKKRRKDYRRTQGHRQHVTVLRVTGITGAA